VGEARGFLKYKREDIGHRSVQERVHDYNEINLALSPEVLQVQAARCMDCGIPFCHSTGCPVENPIPDFNELVYQGQWQEACDLLHTTNNFPEFTGRVCPAPCETACTLAVNDDPVLIKHIEFQIVERGFKNGWIVPQIAPVKTGKRVAVIGSGPAGMTAAQDLARKGYDVRLIEQDEKIGGLLRYGIPDFKLEKPVIDRRMEQMAAEGVVFQTGVTAGEDISGRYLERQFDAVLLAMGAMEPRDLTVPGRELDNVMYAMDFLGRQNRRISGEIVPDLDFDLAQDKHVVVVGGGDTGSDCVGTSRRQGAKSITQIEILPKPSVDIPSDTPWPMWPRIMRTSTSHAEGCDRRWSVMTKTLVGENGTVKTLQGLEVEWKQGEKGWQLTEKAGSQFELKADLVLLAMGFVHVIHKGLLENLGLQLDERGNVLVNNYQTSQPWVFAAGDTIRGASLVVHAIRSGQEAAVAVDKWLRSS